MTSITELNAVNAPKTRTNADATAGVEIKKAAAAAAKKARDDARDALAKASADAKAARDAAREAAANAPKPVTARTFVRDLDRAILEAAGKIVADADIPDELREDVEHLIANQLHHLASPKTGWDVEGLPLPQRSEWV
jgi:hypothetical protein